MTLRAKEPFAGERADVDGGIATRREKSSHIARHGIICAKRIVAIVARRWRGGRGGEGRGARGKWHATPAAKRRERGIDGTRLRPECVASSTQLSPTIITRLALPMHTRRHAIKMVDISARAAGTDACAKIARTRWPVAREAWGVIPAGVLLKSKDFRAGSSRKPHPGGWRMARSSERAVVRAVERWSRNSGSTWRGAAMAMIGRCSD